MVSHNRESIGRHETAYQSHDFEMKAVDFNLFLVDRELERVYDLRLLHYLLALLVVVLKPELVFLLDVLPVPI